MKFLKRLYKNEKTDELIIKYNIPRKYISFNRKNVAKAFFIGIFIAFIPMPMQMFAVLLVAPFVVFNIPIAFTLCWITNPLTMPVIYYIEYITGAYFLDIHVENVVLTVEWFTNNFSKIFIPLYYGAFFYSTLFASITYLLINFFWIKNLDKKITKF